jgi:hypothetical protein
MTRRVAIRGPGESGSAVGRWEGRKTTVWAVRLLLAAFLFYAPQCKPKPQPSAAQARQEAARQREEKRRRYWGDMIGVTDKKQLERLNQAEVEFSRATRQVQQEMNRLRVELKVGTSEGTLSETRRDSLLNLVGRHGVELERLGIEYWARVDSLLTPDQRKSRLFQLKSTPDALLNMSRSAAGQPDPGSPMTGSPEDTN